MGTNAMEKISEFVVPLDRQQTIGVTYATVVKKPVHHSLRTVGFVAYDKQRHWDFVSRVEGYVQKLEISSGGPVGAPAADLFVPSETAPFLRPEPSPFLLIQIELEMRIGQFEVKLLRRCFADFRKLDAGASMGTKPPVFLLRSS